MMCTSLLLGISPSLLLMSGLLLSLQGCNSFGSAEDISCSAGNEIVSPSVQIHPGLCLDVSSLPVLEGKVAYPYAEDWLVAPADRKAGVYRSADGRTVYLDNGLIRRSFHLTENGLGCTSFQNLNNGQQWLRSVLPEAELVIDGRTIRVGGLLGQRNHAFLDASQLAEMQADPEAMYPVGFEVGPIEPRLEWAEVRHHAEGMSWPPRGVSLRMDYAMPFDATGGVDLSDLRDLVFQDELADMDPVWEFHGADDDRTSFENEGKPGEIWARQDAHCYVARALPAETEMVEVVIDPGTDRSTSWGPGLALVLGERVVDFNLRPGDRGGHGHFELRVNGRERLASVEAWAAGDGGLDLAHAYRLRIWRAGDVLKVAAAQDIPGDVPVYETLFQIELTDADVLQQLRVGKTDRQGGASDADVASEWIRCNVLQIAAWGAVDQARLVEAQDTSESSLMVSVHYVIYDGVPLISKWVEIHNQGDMSIELDRFTSELLASPISNIRMGTPSTTAGRVVPYPEPEGLYIETDYAMGGQGAENANRFSYHWGPDLRHVTQPLYRPNWAPCLLRVEPMRGPDRIIPAGGSFATYRVWELGLEGTDRQRNGLARQAMYRTIAPWVTENPLILHVRSTNDKVVRNAIDQAAECGFEMVSLSFGSGLNMENNDPSYLARCRAWADYAAERGIQMGGYSLFSSRNAGPEHNVVPPEGERVCFGVAPALTSEWGQEYDRHLRAFFEESGFMQFTHDGPYPGDADITARPPLQRGLDDSQYVQHEIATDYYHYLCARGVYLRAPDWYFLHGANETAMGYREHNWSLPRADQVTHTRQNIYDGTWEKMPTMGWMFVPLTQYHGGGAAATIEPLCEHLDHYERMMLSNLGMGVQAVYRGTRLYDTVETRDMVQGAVAWYNRYRGILESPMIHGRRADGRDIDWMLHVNPDLEQCAMLVVYNPLDVEVTRSVTVPLYYSGLSERAEVEVDEGESYTVELNRQEEVVLELTIPAGGMAQAVFTRP